MSMRIAQVIYSLQSGGAEQLVRDLSRTLAQRGHSVHLVLVDQWEADPFQESRRQEMLDANVQLHCLGRHPGGIGLGAAIKLHRLMRTFKFDVVHSHLAIPDAIVRACRLLGHHRVAHVSTMHSVRDTRPWYLKLAGHGRQIVYCSSAACRANSPPGEDGIVIPNGVRRDHPSLTVEQKLALRQRLRIGGEDTVFLSVGNLRPEKNYGCALEALHRFGESGSPPFQYLICGEGPEKNVLIHQTAELGLEAQVQLLGARTDVRDLLQVTDVFINTSVYEGLPMAVLEALHEGVACVFPPLPTLLDLAEQMEACVFAEETSAVALAQAIRRATEIRSCHEDIAMRREPMLAPYSLERCADAYYELYCRLASRATSVSASIENDCRAAGQPRQT